MNTYNVIYLDITEFTSAAIVKKDMQNIVSNIETSVINELSEAYPDVQKQDNLPHQEQGIQHLLCKPLWKTPYPPQAPQQPQAQ